MLETYYDCDIKVMSKTETLADIIYELSDEEIDELCTNLEVQAKVGDTVEVEGYMCTYSGIDDEGYHTLISGADNYA